MTYDISDILNHHLKHFVKVKVKLIKNDETNRRTECEYFTLDPQTANYSNLQLQLARLFQIDGEFSISFKKDKSYIPLTSDWDLDGAISEASEPFLFLAVEMDPIDQTLEEWDIISPADIPIETEPTRCSQERKSLAGSILSQFESTGHKVLRAFSLSADHRNSSALNEEGYNKLFDKHGRVRNYRELHMAIFQGGGVDPFLRPDVWKHLLNIYPQGITEENRRAYLNDKCEEYFQLRYRWQQLMRAGTIPDVLHGITNMVKKDVRRTDRTEKFYSGSEDSGNVRALFNILTTYAVNHPSVSYCQGMSDLLSPILYVMKKESEAYVCFCGLMQRTQSNFKLDGKSMKLKFRHMQKMLRFYDESLYNYLQAQDALDLLFCYRWLLLDLKREFPFNDMLTLMEVLWASLPPKSPGVTLNLYEVRFPTPEIYDEIKDKTTAKDYLRMKEDHFGESNDCMNFSHSVTTADTLDKIKKWAFRVRKESMARDTGDDIKLPIHYRKRRYRSYISGKLGRMNRLEPSPDLSIKSCKVDRGRESSAPEFCQSWSIGEVFEEKPQVRDALYVARDFLRYQWCYSNTVNEIQLNNYLKSRQSGKGAVKEECDSDRQRHGSSNSNYSAISDNYYEEAESGNASPTCSGASQSEGYESDLDSKEVSSVTRPDDDSYDASDSSSAYSDVDELIDSMVCYQYTGGQVNFERKKELLPPPHVLGDGNPFLLFLCLEMILNHKSEILKRKFDFSELGIYFDRFVRKHKFSEIYKNARYRFTNYLNMGWDIKDDGKVTDNEF